MSYLALFVVALFWICGYFWKGTFWLSIQNMDVDTGRRELDWDLINREREEMKNWSTWKRTMARIF